MIRSLIVDLFVEDRAHEELLKPLIERVASEEAVAASVRVRSARGGRGRALSEFRLYGILVEKNMVQSVPADLVVVGIDGNCTTFNKKRAEIQDAASNAISGRLVVACPDPHVERWYLTDPVSFEQIVGHCPTVGRRKCARDHYKNLLSRAVGKAGHPPTLGGIEFAREIVQNLDWYRAGNTDRSFKVFVDDLRGGLRRLRGVGQESS